MVGLDLRGRRCVVIGGGQVARRKAESLRVAGAEVVVIAPRAVAMPTGVHVVQRAARPDDLDGAVLAVCATDDERVNAALAEEAQRRGVLVNVVDHPEAGTFVVPAVLQRGALRIAVSSGGAGPVLAQRVRDMLAAQMGSEYGELANLLIELRREWEPRAVRAQLPPAARGAAWRAALDRPLLELLRQGRRDEARQEARNALERFLRHGDS